MIQAEWPSVILTLLQGQVTPLQKRFFLSVLFPTTLLSEREFFSITE